MPNHVTNRLKVIGPNADTIINTITTADRDLDFNIITPRPEILNQANPSMNIVTMAEKYLRTPLPDNPLVAALEEKIRSKVDLDDLSEEDQAMFDYCVKCYRETGYTYWYDWNVANWGTKWNAYNCEIWDDEQTICFETAWSAPLPVIKKLSTMYPDHKFELKYADEDWGSNLGHLVFQAGETIEGDTNGDIPVDLRYKLLIELHPEAEEYYHIKDGELVYVDPEEEEEDE